MTPPHCCLQGVALTTLFQKPLLRGSLSSLLHTKRTALDLFLTFTMSLQQTPHWPPHPKAFNSQHSGPVFSSVQAVAH